MLFVLSHFPFWRRSAWGHALGYKTSGVELAERTSIVLDDTEPRLLNLIDMRKHMARRLPTQSRGNWSKLPPGLTSRLSGAHQLGPNKRPGLRYPPCTLEGNSSTQKASRAERSHASSWTRAENKNKLTPHCTCCPDILHTDSTDIPCGLTRANKG